MEDFGSVARTFNELTNMILDAVHVSSLNMYAVVPGLMLNPAQIAEGAAPGKLFQLEEGVDPRQFFHKLEMGSLSADSVTVWDKLKSSLTEAAGINEIGLGQFAPNSRTSATEVSMTQQSSSAIIRSVAQTVETRMLDQMLDLTWKTGVQHMSKNDDMLKRAAGEAMFDAMIARRKEFASRSWTFQARGISSLISRSQKAKALLQVVGIIGQNETLMKAFLQKIDPVKLVDQILALNGVDITTLQTSERDRLMQSVVGPMQDAGAEGGRVTPQGGGSNLESNMGSLARTLGIGGQGG